MLRPGNVRPIRAEALVALLEGGLDRVVLIDSRPFVDYNTSHILEAVNVNCSKLMKRRLLQDKVHIAELLQHSASNKLELQAHHEVVVYDQSSSDLSSLGSDGFVSVLLVKLERNFPSVHLLEGGFSAFSRLFPGLCEGKSAQVPSCMSQPCLPVANTGPTRILPHLYLGCQRDVLNQDVMQQNAIAYVLNASNTCPKPDFIPESHFLRVPVNDSFCEKILPWLDRSVEFIEKAKASNSSVLVHCLAGISRSATIAIAYIMKRMDMSLDEAYRFVKEKRPTISPNFNFLGQLLDFEKKIKSRHAGQPQPVPQNLPLDRDVSGGALLEPLVLPPEERLLVQALGGLQLAGDDGAHLKRSFSLDIKAHGELGEGAAHRGFVPHSGPGDATAKACHFSPVEEVSEQSPDKDDAHETPRAMSSREAAANFLFGLSQSQQHLARAGPGGALKGWHSDILLGPVTAPSLSSRAGTWYISSTILSGGGSGLAAYGCSHGPEAVRRRGRPRDGGDSRRSWHEESSFEKQLKRRSCQMDFGDGATDRRSRDDVAQLGNRSSFSGSLELIQVS
ncbi:dual specificity protein phosphatase 16 isoform X2 [Dunckerocampus dactyliophorus]|uniref:dual specificity protein phosphatase 16 isoform X2 n=1 Tax=Dunckerocampus dactyliophorus TaxID=161453 RepID=UPI00240607EC|nr:dual specificity protein phosphatase 16 isoform X2 [Dunckerocampus dactyliophorus]